MPQSRHIVAQLFEIMSTALPENVKPLRISELNTAVNELLRETLQPVWVEGELTSWKPYPSGHIYFALKEGERARIDAMMWRANAIRLPRSVEFANGMAVIAFGFVSIYPERGQYRIEVQRLLPVGVGVGEEALRRLKEKLAAKGYFRPERKRPIPQYPRRIGVITSGHGAAIHDILRIFENRWPTRDVIVETVRVQGDAASTEISAAINRLNRIHDGGMTLDVIIVGRGGGSAEDLAAFNCENVADAIFNSAVPVISAVGHEVDFSISDSVADLRATTPTNAAEICAQHWGTCFQLLEEINTRMNTALVAEIVGTRRHLEQLSKRWPFRNPLEGIRDRQQRVDEYQQRLQKDMRRLLERKTTQVSKITARLEALSPLGVLTRGYSITQRPTGELLRDASEVRIGDSIVSQLQRGQIESMVTAIREPE